MTTTLETAEASVAAGPKKPASLTLPARELLAMLKKVRPNARRSFPAAALTALEFQRSGWLKVSTFDYQAGLSVTRGQQDKSKIRQRLVMGDSIIHTLGELVRGGSKDLEVTLRWTWDRAAEMDRLQMDAGGFELAVPSSLASSSEAEFLEVMTSWPHQPEDGPQRIDRTAIVDVRAFRDLIDQIAHAISTDETLPVLTAFRLEFSADRITALATDRYRLIRSWIPTRLNFDGSILIRLSDWKRIRVLLDKPGDMEITLNRPQMAEAYEDVLFAGKDFRAHAAAVNGEYPKINTLFSSEWASHVTVSASEMLRAARIISTTLERNVPLVLTATEDGTALQITGTNGEAESFSPRIAMQAENAQGLRTAFNPKFYQDALKAISGDKIRISYNEQGKGHRITDGAIPLDRLATEELVMPVRLPSQR
ncbi:DNA polymerase III subunit beta [Glutamicibacter halophytocola]|uniref:DNA polymerase III subunit beta n=1 Tax=Glutamicibacter halophytocola TaxID=1933880 RepID=A0AA94Y0F8_9MICC|nr:DNA polymerase III subunit beta [Glutamicibacter halophytocola]UUX60143.1 DNA polymerase III subunit beta [Glutamicibacter halophytocola]